MQIITAQDGIGYIEIDCSAQPARWRDWESGRNGPCGYLALLTQCKPHDALRSGPSSALPCENARPIHYLYLLLVSFYMKYLYAIPTYELSKIFSWTY